MTSIGIRRAARTVVVGLAVVCETAGAQPPAPVNNRTGILRSVDAALATADRGDFRSARLNLERSLALCGTAPEQRECRALFASGLGSLLQRQATVDRAHRDSLYLGAVSYYDRILREAPNDAEAIYGKALTYRALGPHEWMEPFFTQAPSLDPGRGALYLTFQGDYYASASRWPQALAAYRAAARADVDNDGARSGVVTALSALGPARRGELLQYAQDWELRYPASAADAYRAILTLSFAPTSQRDAQADTPIIGLVRVQSRNRLAVGAVPESVSTKWTPVREIRDFMQTPSPQVASWWTLSPQRLSVLAQSALAGGRAAANAGNYALAERLWGEGVQIVRQAPSSTVSLDLQRELAMLYFHQPALDPDQRKFGALEQEIFEGKMGALATGDLEAAQRYHTTLGLVYLERGVWRSEQRARNAEQQFSWALDKVDERLRRQGFYQPVPDLRQLLAHGLDSTGSRSQAARLYVEAAAEFLDIDDLDAADSAVRSAKRLGTDAVGPSRVLAARTALGEGGASAAGACDTQGVNRISGAGDAAFVARQRFKMLADCVKLGGAGDRQRATAAFTLVDSAKISLVGGADVARFERVMTALLQPFGVVFQSTHLDRAPAPGDSPIMVSLPGETVPLWYTASPDDMIAARVISAIGSTVRPFPITVAAGVVSVPSTSELSPALLARLRAVDGVKSLQVR